ncbi:MAG: 50S ribosomal protein L3 [Candidatus Staskawiczbacteria bacterium RIFCSPHIGHO2_02_FULL_34_9]|uniref:50S ribosomal protein L3 n=1 Tax=Candidatus Staskawiczbacteria bacterium RIFCSPHIGHO2_02_FULL_34_9 TaxID=1802206 RepID=A0A1G2HZQ3_9BACT|nr:MAG: 50S ribosomal protein L3 [Candidatus Staskawiczbacteria bacterium RIFCSPHIGHO2_02_FULL_34_9]
MKFIIGKKIEMSQVFDEKGNLIPVTLVSAGPCVVLQRKTKEKENYDALQIGFEKIEKMNKIKKSQKTKPFKHVKEVRDGEESLNVGDEINVSIFKEGDKVNVSGISKGKGYQGGVKRHGFHGRNRTHGAKHEERQLGSVGRRFPQRVTKGRKMPGRMGRDTITVKNLVIEKIDIENNILAIRGAIPGHRGTLLEIKG